MGDRAELARTLLAAHRAVFDGTRSAVADLTAEQWDAPTGCPGWSVRDQLAHIVGIERAMLGDPVDDVELPADLGHVITDFDRATEAAVHARRGVPVAVLLVEADETFARRLAVLDALDPATLDEPLDGVGGMRLKGSQLLRTRVFDMTCHEQDIRRAVGRPGDLDGPHVDIATEQVLRAWAKLLPARLASDRVVRIDLGARTVDIDLAPDGGVGAGGSSDRRGDVAASIGLDVGMLLALGTGRSDAPGADDLEVSGDRVLVAELLTVASVTP